jgi:hypothetical protein
MNRNYYDGNGIAKANEKQGLAISLEIISRMARCLKLVD